MYATALPEEPNGCTPNNPTSTIVSSVLICISCAGAVGVCIAGAYGAFHKGKQKLINKMVADPIATVSEGKDDEDDNKQASVTKLSLTVDDNENNTDNTSLTDINIPWHNKKLLLQFLRYLPKEMWSKKRCYFPFITHIIDQASDIAVIIQFYQIYIFEKNNNYNCKHINGANLFFLSLASFFLYKIVSCIWIYKITDGKIFDTFIQFFDLKLYQSLYINFLTNSNEPSNPQRYLQLLEATLESFPQCVIQLYYLFQVGYSDDNNNNNNNLWVIYASLLFSIVNIASKMISEDKVYFEKKIHSLEFSFKPFYINLKYIFRFIFRLIDFFHRLLLVLLIWIILGDVVLSVYFCTEFCWILFVIFQTGKLR